MVEILLATYNSSRYLREQLDSLLAQDEGEILITIRDGGSSDGTPEIIREYSNRAGGRIRFLGSSRSDALGNFAALLREAREELMMFCDHDDVWMPDKVSRTLALYRRTASECPPGTPIMVFTDSVVTDAELKPLADSMMASQKLDPRRMTFPKLLVQNVPSGNTMLFNRALREKALPLPEKAVMHDHWLTLVAERFGRMAYLDEPTLLYRQHGNNVYGATAYGMRSFLKRLAGGRAKIRARFQQNLDQGTAFLERYRAELDPETAELLEQASRFRGMGFWARRRFLLKYGVLKTGFWRNAGMFALI